MNDNMRINKQMQAPPQIVILIAYLIHLNRIQVRQIQMMQKAQVAFWGVAGMIEKFMRAVLLNKQVSQVLINLKIGLILVQILNSYDKEPTNEK